MLRTSLLQYQFCQALPCIVRPIVKIKNPQFWTNTQFEGETKIEDTQMPQPVITQRLKFLANRNEFIKELHHFQLHSVSSSYYQKSLYDISNFIECSSLSVQCKVSEEQAILLGLNLQQSLTPEEVQLLKFHFGHPQNITVISFLDGVLSLLKSITQFQDLLFLNVANNLFELFSDVSKRTKNLDEKLKEVFTEIGNVFLRFDYLSQSQPTYIGKIVGQLNDLMITNQIKLSDLTNYHNTANTFIHKYYEINPNKLMSLTVIDYKNFLYTLFLSEIRPQGLIQDVVNKFANCGLQNGNIGYTLDLMSMMLLYGIPCTEAFLNKVKEQRRQKLTIPQIYVFLKSYEFAKVPLYEYSTQIFLDTVNHVQQDREIVDANGILMFARICNQIFSSQFINSKAACEKRNDKILTFVEKNIFRLQKDMQFPHILLIANIFNKHLKNPVFLIEILMRKLEEKQINEQTLSLYNDFLEITHEFYQQQYTQLQSTLPNQFYPPIEYQTILKSFVLEIFEKNFVSQVSTNLIKVLSLPCFVFEKNLVVSILKKHNVFSNEFEIVSKVMKMYHIPLNELIMESMQNSDDRIKICEALFHICQLGKFTNYTAKLTTLAQNTITQLIAENESYLVEQREIDDFVHTYSSQINQTAFKAFQYIPIILSSLNVKLEETQLSILNQLFERTCVLWQEDTLALNLILLNKMNFLNFSIYAKSAENLVTCFDVSKNGENLYPSGLLKDSTILFELVSAYLQQISKCNSIDTEGLKVVGYLAFLAYDRLEKQDLILLQKLLGTNRQMYYKKLFIKLSNSMIFDLEGTNILPYAAQYTILNDSLRKKLIQYLQNQDLKTITLDLLLATKNQLISIENIDQLFSELSTEKKQQYIKPILQNLITCWNINHSITSIITFARKEYQALDQESQCIYVLLQLLELNQEKLKSGLSIQQPGIFQLNFIYSAQNQYLKEKITELLQASHIPGQKFLKQESYLYFPSFLTEIDRNLSAQYKISQIKKTNIDDLQESDLLKFLTKNINFPQKSKNNNLFECLVSAAKILHIDINEYFDSLPEESKSERIALIKQDEDFLGFVITMQASLYTIPIQSPIILIPENTDNTENTEIKEKKMDVDSIIESLEKKNEIQDSFQISTEMQFNYCAVTDICYTNEQPQLTPLKILGLLPLSQKVEKTYIINYKSWSGLNPNQQDQKKIIESLLK